MKYRRSVGILSQMTGARSGTRCWSAERDAKNRLERGAAGVVGALERQLKSPGARSGNQKKAGAPER